MDKTLSDINVYWHESLNPFICLNIIELVFPWSKGKLLFLIEKIILSILLVPGHPI